MEASYVADPASPKQFESPTSSLIDPYPSHVDSTADVDHHVNGHAGTPQQSPPHEHWISRRSKRKVKYPAPFDRFFEHLDVWKLLAVLGAMVTSIATFRGYEFISKECMRAVILMLCFSFFFLMIAYTLQDMVPEIAVGTMLIGIGLVIASFHTAGLQLLDMPEQMWYLTLFVLLVGYAVLFSLTLHKIVKDDVRVKEENGETKLYDDMV